jgi:hypothetical protein
MRRSVVWPSQGDRPPVALVIANFIELASPTGFEPVLSP